MSLPYHIVIPARLASTRLPRKPLLDIAGKPLVQRVCEVAESSHAVSVVVATEDPEIADVVTGFGGRAVLTASSHESGTDRLAEVVELAGWDDDTIVVNLQGDEPGIPPALLDRAAALLEEHPSAGIATFGTPIRSVEELFDPAVVKVVASQDGLALYFSRAPIPWVRRTFGHGTPTSLPSGVPFTRHLGLYAYRAGTLRQFSRLPPAPAERAEALEQLRAMSHGIAIALGHIDEPPGHGVDTPEDLARVRALFGSNET